MDKESHIACEDETAGMHHLLSSITVVYSGHASVEAQFCSVYATLIVTFVSTRQVISAEQRPSGEYQCSSQHGVQFAEHMLSCAAFDALQAITGPLIFSHG